MVHNLYFIVLVMLIRFGCLLLIVCFFQLVENKSESFIGSFSVHKSEKKQVKRNRPNIGLPLITPQQYASRKAMLSSLVVAWSPVLQLSSESGPTFLNISYSSSAILAVGGKSGKIALLRISEPQGYSIEHGRDSVDAVLIGLLQASNAWITAISWGVHSADASTSQVLLAAGSSDGRWVGYTSMYLPFSCFAFAIVPLVMNLLLFLVNISSTFKFGMVNSCMYVFSCNKTWILVSSHLASCDEGTPFNFYLIMMTY